jgi:transcriptional regulator with XRE-family HTH domain
MVRDNRGSKKIRETAKEIRIGTATLMRIENGRIPDVETFGKVCKWLNVDPGSFLGFESQSAAGDITQGELTSVSAHFKTDRNPQPTTVHAIAQMVMLALKNQPRKGDF